jgi:citrate lyase subunit beta / citryl-CoA lyase
LGVSILSERFLARSYLYVPGGQRSRLEKSVGRGADAVIADLEDALALGEKESGRQTLGAWLAELPPDLSVQVWVRINRESAPEDIAAVTGRSLTGIVVPKADPEFLHDVDALLTEQERQAGLPPGTVAVLPLIESAAGLLSVASVAAAPRVHRLGIGEADLIGELGLRPGPDRAELMPLRLQVVVASAAARIAAPVAPTSTDFRDLTAFRATATALLRLGFRGRTAIHPTQVPVINEVFTPGAEEVAAAHDLIARFEAASSGVVVDDGGRMVDEAVVRAARDTVQRARVAALTEGSAS